MMQTAEPWRGNNVRVCRDFQCSLAPTGSLLLQAEVSSIIVVQLGYKTPIKPAFGKYSIGGIPGTGSRSIFARKRDEGAMLSFVACGTS